MTEKQIKKQEWSRTKKGLCFNIYSDQRKNSKNRGHRPPEYTRDELYEWLMSNTNFHNLYNEWKQSKFKRHLRPSVDRKYDDIHYCMSNIQIMTFRDNEKKFQKSMRECKVIHKVNPQKKVNQISKDGNYIIATYGSMQEASRETNLSQGNISMVCSGQRKTTGGFRWEYAKDK